MPGAAAAPSRLLINKAAVGSARAGGGHYRPGCLAGGDFPPGFATVAVWMTRSLPRRGPAGPGPVSAPLRT
jgi:hypothetical protein